MILAVSQFRVANGLEEAVRQAFRDRPHLVDQAPGFLGMEVFANQDDPTVFWLTTRWADKESFHAWHSSEAHALSHGGIPKGLRLDASYTKLTLLHEIAESPEDAGREAAGDAWTELYTRHVWSSPVIHVLVADIDGAIRACNPRMAELLGVPDKQLRGGAVWSYLTAPDVAALQGWIRGSSQAQRESMLLNFVSIDHVPHTLECSVSVQGGAFALIGNVPFRQEQALQTQLIEMNNELAVLAREHAGKNKELISTKLALEKTVHELNTLYWRIRKIREVLPICLKCGKVQSGETRWEDLADFMIARFPFLSHGYCPDCASRGIADWDDIGPQP